MSQKILVVDDDGSSRKLTQSYLELAGYNVFFAEDGSQVLKAIEEYQPDAIIMDLLMPDVSGSEAVALIQENDVACNIPIIFLTAVGSSDGVQEAVFDIKVGEKAYPTLIKPVNGEFLIAELKKVLIN